VLVPDQVEAEREGHQGGAAPFQPRALGRRLAQAQLGPGQVVEVGTWVASAA
jgi:hypothetical protein